MQFTAFVGKNGRTPDVDARGWSGGSDVAEPPWPGATKSIVPPPPSVVAEEDAGHAAADAPSALAVVLAALAVRTLYRAQSGADEGGKVSHGECMGKHGRRSARRATPWGPSGHS